MYEHLVEDTPREAVPRMGNQRCSRLMSRPDWQLEEPNSLSRGKWGVWNLTSVVRRHISSCTSDTRNSTRVVFSCHSRMSCMGRHTLQIAWSMLSSTMSSRACVLINREGSCKGESTRISARGPATMEPYVDVLRWLRRRKPNVQGQLSARTHTSKPNDNCCRGEGIYIGTELHNKVRAGGETDELRARKRVQGGAFALYQQGQVSRGRWA